MLGVFTLAKKNATMVIKNIAIMALEITNEPEMGIGFETQKIEDVSQYLLTDGNIDKVINEKLTGRSIFDE